MEEDGKFRVEKFNSQNFSLWKMQMEDYLYQKDLYLPLGGKKNMPTGMTDEEWNLLNRKALGIVRLCLAASVAFNISKETTTEGLIKALEKLYEKTSISNKVFLMKCTLNFDDVVGAILSEEMRWKSSGETSGNSLSAESRGRKMERGKSPGYRSKSRKGRSKSRSGIVCWKCRKKGHLEKDCRSRKGKEGDA
eukprot:PITA_30769